VRCDHCALDVPDGVFCTRCGAHQGTTQEAGNAKAREHRYAAHPGEHVAQPSVFTTLFPHLGHHKIHEFRWAFIAGLAGVLILYLAGLITAAILVSAFLVPVLYLIYLYEAQVYRDEPALVLGFTIGGGVVVGIAVTLFERLIYNPFQYNVNPLGGASISVGAVLILGLLMPVIQEALKPLPALFLPNRADFPETVDGLVFGVAAGLGFSLAEIAAHICSPQDETRKSRLLSSMEAKLGEMDGLLADLQARRTALFDAIQELRSRTKGA